MVGQPGQGERRVRDSGGAVGTEAGRIRSRSERRVRYSGGAVGTEAGQMLLSVVKWRRDLLRTENAITASSSWQIDA